VGELNAALKRDPNFVLAYIGLSRAYNSLSENSDDPNPLLDLAKQAAAQAVNRNAHLASAHATPGIVLFSAIGMPYAKIRARLRHSARA